MQAELVKSLEALIDESLAEIEELKKSDRFSASEVSIGDSESGMKSAGDKNGSLGKEEDCDDKDKKEKEDEDDKEDDDMDKAEGKNREADPNGGSHQPVAKDESGMPEGTMAKEEDDMDKAEGKNREADPNGGSHKAASLSKSVEERIEKMEATMSKIEEFLTKSTEEKSETTEELNKSEEAKEEAAAEPEAKEDLFKSYVDEKFSSIETKFENIAKLVQEIADTPVPAKSVSYKDVQPLAKSEDQPETLNKADVANKLLELKKSGTEVLSEDITGVELGGPDALAKIVDKYNIK